MAFGEAIRRFGPPPGAPGIEVVERSGGNSFSDPSFGTVFMFGFAKRGPMGLPIPCASKRQYDEIFGDPRDSNWHLFPSGEHQLPDAVDGFFATGGGAGRIFVTRLQMDHARAATVILKNRIGADALQVTAANEGRWGGQLNSVAASPVITATQRTFTLIAPGLQSNEMVDAYAEFTDVPGQRFKIVSNTAADAVSGESVFVVGAQYDLLSAGVNGPVALTGTATYVRYKPLTGTAAFPLTANATGNATINGTVITGVATKFLAEYTVGHNVYSNGEARSVESITSDTTMTIDESFSVEGAGLILQRDNLIVTGTGSAFDADLAVGTVIYATFDGVREGRAVAAITDATTLVLDSGFTQPMTPGSIIEQDGLSVTGVGTGFVAQLQAGQFLVDPNRAGATAKIVSIQSATALTLEKPFAASFTAAQLTKQSQKGAVYLDQAAGSGLSVEIGQGTRYPDTHFSLNIYFNSSLVLQVPDASLDRNDERGLFVEPLVNDSNIAYRADSRNYQKWVTVKSLWTSAYTTAAGSDVRPANGNGRIVAITSNRVYTVGAFDYQLAIGNMLYPNPYRYPRGYYRIKKAQAPVVLQGTVSSTGVDVTGTSTAFKTQLVKGDYLYDPNTKSARKVRAVLTNTTLVLETVFSTDLPALTVASKTGYLEVDQGYDVTIVADVADYFSVIYPTSLAKGYDGDGGHIQPYHFTRYADPDFNAIESAVWGKNYGLIRICTPGIDGVEVQKAFAYLASLKAFEYRASVPSLYTSAVAAEAFVNQDLGRNDFVSIAFPSYGYISDPLSSAGDRMIPLCGEIMGGESARSTVAKGYHVPFAGMNAILPRILKLPFSPMPQDEAVLNVAGIQPIKRSNGNTIVFGARTPSLSPTYDFLHIRRIQSNYVRVFLEARVLLELLFLPNQPMLLEQALLILNNFARNEYKKGVFTNYLSFSQAVQVSGDVSASDLVVDDTASSDAIVSIVNGRLVIYFRYVPTGILEQLSIQAGPDIVVSQYGSTINRASSL